MNCRTIDFARRPPLPMWVAPSLLLLLAALAWGGYRYTRAERDVAGIRAQSALQQQALIRIASTPAPTVAAPRKERVKAVNDAIAALNVPWPALLAAIENARPPDVALTRIEPRPKDQSVLVTAQADDMGALIGFMERVSRAAPFVRVVPVRQETALDAGVSRRQATFEARWGTRP